MLTRLIPEQISKFWDIIKYAIENSLPPIVNESPDKMNNILTSLLSDKSQCWVSSTLEGNNRKFEGVVITRVLYDDASDTKNLLIYCLYGYELVNNDSWLKGLITLTKYAKSVGCSQIVGYTDIDYVVKLAKELGSESSYHFISFDINKIIKKDIVFQLKRIKQGDNFINKSRIIDIKIKLCPVFQPGTM